MWFSDPGTTRAIGTIDPLTQAISEFSAGLNPGSNPGVPNFGPDGRWRNLNVSPPTMTVWPAFGPPW